MKKLLVLAAVAAMAMGAKADWTLVKDLREANADEGKFYISSLRAGFSDEVTGWTDYSQLYLLSNGDYAKWMTGGALQSQLTGSSFATASEGEVFFDDPGEHTLDWFTGNMKADYPKTVSGSVSAGTYYPFVPFDEKPIYAVITDGETGYFVEGISSMTSGGGIEIDNSWLGANTPFKNADLKSFGAESVPEPTSALLLLLGVAGLALKRKRA